LFILYSSSFFIIFSILSFKFIIYIYIYLILFIDSNCEKAISKYNGIDFCNHCASPINNEDIVSLYAIDWIIDDGTSVLTVTADSSISTVNILWHYIYIKSF